VSRPTDEFLVGVLSDTHDHLYPEVKELLDGVDHIVHAGDVCRAEILSALRAIAPVTAVRGNCDVGVWAEALPVRAELELHGVRFLVGHVGGRLREDADLRSTGAEPVDVVVFGHSHQALVEQRNGVIHLNPGSAGPRRYGRPRTLAFVRIVTSACDEPPSTGRVGDVTADDGVRAPARITADIVVVDV
jgi:putative phosphoesterase